MLHQIIEYARSKQLDVEPGFAPKFVKWASQCDSEGKFLSLLELAARKEKGMEFLKCPNLTQPEMKAGGVTKSHFLVESLSVIAGASPKNDRKEQTRTELKHKYFQTTLSEASRSVASLAGPAALITQPILLESLRAAVLSNNAALTDQATFLVGGRYLVEGTDWHDWWRDHRVQSVRIPKHKSDSTGTVRCFVGGNLVTPASTHEKIKGLSDVGGRRSGDTLISFKQESFCSYQFKQSANSSMSAETAKAYVAGLNELILRQSRRLAGSKVVFWFKKPVPLDDDPFDYLSQGDETAEGAALERMRELLSAIAKGKRPDLANNTYHGMVLSSNLGRVVVRSWWEGPYGDLLTNILKWFKDLEIVDLRKGTQPRLPKFFAVLAATVRPRVYADPRLTKVYDEEIDIRDIVPSVETGLWRAALLNLPIPEAAHSKVLMRVRALVTCGESITFVQAGLLKAFHLRRKQMIGVTLDPEGPVPYQCGRLLAVLSALQVEALGDVGAGVVERFYPAASSTPALVLGRLIQNAQNHLQKVRSDRPGLANWFDERIQAIIAAIPVNDLPTTLSLEQQSLFALGFYQQKAARTKD